MVDDLEIIAKFYDSDGHIRMTNWTNEDDIGAGSTVRYELEALLAVSPEQSSSAEVLVTTEI